MSGFENASNIIINIYFLLARLKRKTLTDKEIEKMKDYTPSLNQGGSRLFRSLRDKGNGTILITTEVQDFLFPYSSLFTLSWKKQVMFLTYIHILYLGNSVRPLVILISYLNEIMIGF